MEALGRSASAQSLGASVHATHPHAHWQEVPKAPSLSIVYCLVLVKIEPDGHHIMSFSPRHQETALFILRFSIPLLADDGDLLAYLPR